MKSIALPKQSFAVRFKTELCEADGTVIRVLSEGKNTLTDWGMDSLATNNITALCNYLHLSDTLGPAKRVMTGGTTLSLTITSPTNIAVAASSNYFASGDVGNTLWIDGLGQEMKVTAFTDAQNVTCSTRSGAWLPSVGTPGTGPFSAASVHFTSVNILANQTQKFSTYDTTATNYQTTLNDSVNSRWNTQRIWISATVTGSSWTVNQLGWSDGNGGNNIFGKTNLSAADTIPVGKRYRVTANFYSAYTPIDLTSQTLDFGATVGSFVFDIKQEVFPNETDTEQGPFTNPSKFNASPSSYLGLYYSTFTMVPIKWKGDSGYVVNPHGGTTANFASTIISDSTYSSGSHSKVRSLTLNDSFSITAATGLVVKYALASATPESLAFRVTSGTFTKPTGWLCTIPFQIFWTRELTS